MSTEEANQYVKDNNLLGKFCLQRDGEIYALDSFKYTTKTKRHKEPIKTITSLVLIYAKNVGTNFVTIRSFYNLQMCLEGIKEDRYRFLTMQDELMRFNYELIKSKDKKKINENINSHKCTLCGATLDKNFYSCSYCGTHK